MLGLRMLERRHCVVLELCFRCRRCRGRVSGYFRFVSSYLGLHDLVALEVDEFSAVALTVRRPRVLAFDFLIWHDENPAVQKLEVFND